MPPGSVSASRDRVVSEATADGNDGRGTQDPWAINSRAYSGRRSKRNTGSQSASNNSAQTSTAPLLSPTPAFTPSVSSTYPSSATTASSPAPTTVSRTSSLRQRASSVVQWAKANRLATLLGALILVSLILYLLLAFGKRRPGVAKAKRAKAQKVQPKFSEVNELTESSAPATVAPTSSVISEPAAQNSVVTPDKPVNRIPVPQETPSTANAAVASKAGTWGLRKPAVAPVGAGSVEYSSEEEEREVFEL